MNKQEEEILLLIEKSTDGYIEDYKNKVYDNLKDLNEKEKKHAIWLVFIIFLYLIIDNTFLTSFQVGPFSINNISIISRILPVLLVSVLLSSSSVIKQKNYLELTLTTILKKKMHEKSKSEKTINFWISMYIPYNISYLFVDLIDDQPRKWRKAINFFKLLPLLSIAISPYIVLIFMLINLFKNYTNEYLGIICFILTLWGTIVLLFFTNTKRI